MLLIGLGLVALFSLDHVIVGPSPVSEFHFCCISEIRMVTAGYEMLCDQAEGIVLWPSIMEQMSFV